MGEKLTNKDFDNIFRESIDNLETQPSESFWIKASEDSLFNGTQAKKKVVRKWKMIAASLAAAVVIMAAYIIDMQSKLDSTGKKLALVEKKNSVQALANEFPVANTKVDASSMQEKNNQSRNQSLATVKPVAISPNAAASSQTTAKFKKHALNTQVKYVAKSYNQSVSNNNSGINNNSTYENVAISNASEQKNTGKALASTIQALNGTNIISVPLSNDYVALTDNIVPVQNTVKPVEGKSVFSKMSVSLFYEPYISDEFFENQSSDIVTQNNVSTSEEEKNPFIAGIKLGYDISKHWTITTGCLYYNFNVSVSPTTIFAQKQQNGDVGYSFQTSMGTVTCPYGSATPSPGDWMTVSGKETADYISVPLQVKYNFITSGNWGFNISGGLMANVVAYRAMSMHWQQNSWNEGNATEGIDNSKKLYGSYYFATAVSYRLFSGFSLFLEPSLQGSPIFTSAKNSSPYLGLGTGITYHL